MDEVRIKRIELDVHNLKRRVTDHDDMHVKMYARITNTENIMAAHEEMISVAREVTELLKQLIKYLSWVGKIAKWVSTVAVAFTASWHAAKWALAKLWVFQ
jgi:hypothetical protein